MKIKAINRLREIATSKQRVEVPYEEVPGMLALAQSILRAVQGTVAYGELQSAERDINIVLGLIENKNGN